MTCKLNHEDPEVIPDFLCRACHPELLTTRAEVDAAIASETAQRQEYFAAQVRQRKLKQLRAEEKRLSDLIDEIGPRDPAARRKLYDAIKQVEREIDGCVA